MLLRAAATITRHLETCLELVADFDDADEARVAPRSPLEIELTAVLALDGLAHVRAHAFGHGYIPAASLIPVNYLRFKIFLSSFPPALI